MSCKAAAHAHRGFTCGIAEWGLQWVQPVSVPHLWFLRPGLSASVTFTPSILTNAELSSASGSTLLLAWLPDTALLSHFPVLKEC